MSDENAPQVRRGFFITDRAHTPAGTTAIALFGGALLGAAAWWLEGALPSPWGTLAGTSALWGLAAAAFVTLQSARGMLAVAAGAAALLGMVSAYAVLDSATPQQLLLYLAVGVVAGALFGLAASVADSTLWQNRAFAAAVLGGVVAGEGLYGIFLVDSAGPQWWSEFALGLVIALLIGRSLGTRALSLLMAGVTALCLLSAYSLYDTLMVA